MFVCLFQRHQINYFSYLYSLEKEIENLLFQQYLFSSSEGRKEGRELGREGGREGGREREGREEGKKEITSLESWLWQISPVLFKWIFNNLYWVFTLYPIMPAQSPSQSYQCQHVLIAKLFPNGPGPWQRWASCSSVSSLFFLGTWLH